MSNQKRKFDELEAEFKRKQLKIEDDKKDLELKQQKLQKETEEASADFRRQIAALVHEEMKSADDEAKERIAEIQKIKDAKCTEALKRYQALCANPEEQDAPLPMPVEDLKEEKKVALPVVAPVDEKKVSVPVEEKKKPRTQELEMSLPFDSDDCIIEMDVDTNSLHDGLGYTEEDAKELLPPASRGCIIKTVKFTVPFGANLDVCRSAILQLAKPGNPVDGAVRLAAQCAELDSPARGRVCHDVGRIAVINNQNTDEDVTVHVNTMRVKNLLHDIHDWLNDASVGELLDFINSNRQSEGWPEEVQEGVDNLLAIRGLLGYLRFDIDMTKPKKGDKLADSDDDE